MTLRELEQQRLRSERDRAQQYKIFADAPIARPKE
jgi:hypothetical protein